MTKAATIIAGKGPQGVHCMPGEVKTAALPCLHYSHALPSGDSVTRSRTTAGKHLLSPPLPLCLSCACSSQLERCTAEHTWMTPGKFCVVMRAAAGWTA